MREDWLDGVVREYDDSEGVGVIDSQVTPGGCWFHYSMIEMPGLRTLVAGQSIHFILEGAVEQDGFVFRAVRLQLTT
jgi:CspA family cold shock protein